DLPGQRWDLSPDGSTIVVSPAGRGAESNLQMGKLGGREWKPVPGLAPDMTIAWLRFAPDGKTLAATVGRGVGTIRGTEAELWLLPLPAVSGKPRRVLPSEKNAVSGVRQVDWMPDGRTLVISAARTNEPFEIFLLDLKTERMRRLTNGLL